MCRGLLGEQERARTPGANFYVSIVLVRYLNVSIYAILFTRQLIRICAAIIATYDNSLWPLKFSNITAQRGPPLALAATMPIARTLAVYLCKLSPACTVCMLTSALAHNAEHSPTSIICNHSGCGQKYLLAVNFHSGVEALKVRKSWLVPPTRSMARFNARAILKMRVTVKSILAQLVLISPAPITTERN